jgi:hypothetical protein
MRTYITVIIAFITSFYIVVESGMADALIVFFLSGAVPGTNIIVSPTAMMVGFAAIAWLVLMRMTALGTLNIITMNRLVKRHTEKQRRMPKRRYGRI